MQASNTVSKHGVEYENNDAHASHDLNTWSWLIDNYFARSMIRYLLIYMSIDMFVQPTVKLGYGEIIQEK